ncbi:MAG: methionyl-tRNA formyltransferase [Alphaproteobacteria bacterium]|jgi:methionyl-tRNA formyltransferase|nr:methionyl-tRNA formyltransferase [Alphaproteobacteria bacterium]PPR14710.1 MAG: Methionyl-tRNA formyltransferase [Alphaproteobacteria bacterium MarineAlpha12_Bin1]|tara:strand:- start:874 stop:1788 length:915 start_codon:yes stop_codon:yes gene_type:complete
MKLAFFGSPEFAVPALRALVGIGHEIVRVYTQPSQVAGRGKKVQETAIYAIASELGLQVCTPSSLTDEAVQEEFKELNLDAAIVVAYGLILKKPILDAPKFGCFNIHASLLPRWRGAAPIQRAIMAGDEETGVSIMRMNEGLDTGPLLLSETVPIRDFTTSQKLHNQLAILGSGMIVEALEGVFSGRLKEVPQPEEGITYAQKLTREEGRIDWNKTAEEIERKVRAFTPWPGAWFNLGDVRLKVLEVELVEGSGEPGVVIDNNLTVSCRTGSLRLKTVQREGRRPMSVETLLRGFSIETGSLLT